MTLNEYVVNPLGKGDSSLPGGKLLIKQLEDKYYALDRENLSKWMSTLTHTVGAFIFI